MPVDTPGNVAGSLCDGKLVMQHLFCACFGLITRLGCDFLDGDTPRRYCAAVKSR
jgi:hypothetical protein